MTIKNNILLFSFLSFSLVGKVFSDDLYNLNYDQVEIAVVSEDIAKFTNKTIILDPRVKGKVKVISATKLDTNQVWEVYINTLNVLGFSINENNGFYEVIPESEILGNSNLVDTKNTNKYITEIITLQNRDVSSGFIDRFKRILSRQSFISIFPEINSFLLVDTEQNVKKIRDLVKALDKISQSDISILSLNNMSAIEGVRIITKLKDSNTPKINEFTALAFMPTNSIILVANTLTTATIKDILTGLDSKIDDNDQIDVVYLKHAKAEDVASILTTVASSFVNEDSSKKTIITSHANTNSLVISAGQSELEQLKKLIAKIDIRRAQVLVEAIIVDLSESAAQKLGVGLLINQLIHKTYQLAFQGLMILELLIFYLLLDQMQMIQIKHWLCHRYQAYSTLKV